MVVSRRANEAAGDSELTFATSFQALREERLQLENELIFRLAERDAARKQVDDVCYVTVSIRQERDSLKCKKRTNKRRSNLHINLIVFV